MYELLFKKENLCKWSKSTLVDLNKFWVKDEQLDF